MDYYTKYKHYKKEYLKTVHQLMRQRGGEDGKVEIDEKAVVIKQVVVGDNYSIVLTEDHRVLSYGKSGRVNSGLETSGTDKYVDITGYLTEIMEANGFNSYVKKIIVTEPHGREGPVYILMENGIVLNYHSLHGFIKIEKKDIFLDLDINDDTESKITNIFYNVRTNTICFIIGSYIITQTGSSTPTSFFKLFGKVSTDLGSVKKVLINVVTDTRCFILMENGDLYDYLKGYRSITKYDKIDSNVVDIAINAWSSLLVAKQNSISEIKLHNMKTQYEEKFANIESIAEHPLDADHQSTIYDFDLIIADKKLYNLVPVHGFQQIQIPNNYKIKEVESYQHFLVTKTIDDTILINGDISYITSNFKVSQIDNTDWYTLNTDSFTVTNKIYLEKVAELSKNQSYADYYIKKRPAFVPIERYKASSFLDKDAYNTNKQLKIVGLPNLADRTALRFAIANPNFFHEYEGGGNEDFVVDIIIGNVGDVGYRILRINITNELNLSINDQNHIFRKIDTNTFKNFLKDQYIDSSLSPNILDIRYPIRRLPQWIVDKLFLDTGIEIIQYGESYRTIRSDPTGYYSRYSLEVNESPNISYIFNNVVSTTDFDRSKPILEQYITKLNKEKLWEPESKFSVKFINEPGIDASGLTKELYTMLGKELVERGYLHCVGETHVEGAELTEEKITKRYCKGLYTVNRDADFKVFALGLDEKDIVSKENEELKSYPKSKMSGIQLFGIHKVAQIFTKSVLSGAKLNLALSYVVLGQIILPYVSPASISMLDLLDEKEFSKETIADISSKIFEPNIEQTFHYNSKPNEDIKLDDKVVNLLYLVNLDDCQFKNKFTVDGIDKTIAKFNIANTYDTEPAEKVFGNSSTQATVADFAKVIKYDIDQAYNDNISDEPNAAALFGGNIGASLSKIIAEELVEHKDILTSEKGFRLILEKIQKLFRNPPTVEQWIKKTTLRVNHQGAALRLIKFQSVAELKTEIEKESRHDKYLEQYLWFWEIMTENPDQIENVYRFMTSSESFIEANHSFDIETTEDHNHLPHVHTCFNHIIMPAYPTKDILKAKLFKAVEVAVGFGLTGGKRISRK